MLLVLLLPSAAPAITVDEVLERGSHTMDGVRDFVTILTFRVQSASVRVPDSRVRIYFKAPDKFKPEAVDGDFTILPKTYHFAVGNILQRLAEDHDARLLREEALAGRKQWVVQFTPQEDGPVKRHVVHVDQENSTVSRLRTEVDGDRPVTMSLTYRKWQQAYLPATATIDGTTRTPAGGAEKIEPVRITMAFGRYEVNKGLSDAIFSDRDR